MFELTIKTTYEITDDQKTIKYNGETIYKTSENITMDMLNNIENEFDLSEEAIEYTDLSIINYIKLFIGVCALDDKDVELGCIDYHNGKYKFAIDIIQDLSRYDISDDELEYINNLTNHKYNLNNIDITKDIYIEITYKKIIK